MTLNLAIDAVGAKHSGGATVLTDLLPAATTDCRFAQLLVFCSPRDRRIFGLPASMKVREIECPFSEASRMYRLWWLENRLPFELRRCGADVLLCMEGMGSAGRLPHITFIQQSLPFCSDIVARLGTLERLRMGVILRAMERSCKSSRRVIVQTPTMLRRVAETFRIPSARITVALPTVSDLPNPVTPSNRLATMRDTKVGLRLLYVGNESPYKNVSFLIGAMGRLRACLPDVTLFLTWPPEHLACRVEGVVGLGYLRGAELREAYELATALVMPSLVETVGLPMFEAMNVGTPVLAANRPYAHDVCEDTAIFFDPLDLEDFVGKVLRLLADECLRMDLSCRGHKLIEKRRSERPYERILDVVAEVASARIPRR